MIQHRNETQSGHILTIEDPLEYMFRHSKSIVNQREVGTDTTSYETALVSAMREAPDVLMVGEIRDRETLKHALILPRPATCACPPCTPTTATTRSTAW